MRIHLISTIALISALASVQPAHARYPNDDGAAANNTVDLLQREMPPDADAAKADDPDGVPASRADDSAPEPANISPPSGDHEAVRVPANVSDDDQRLRPVAPLKDSSIERLGISNEPAFAIPERERRPIGTPREIARSTSGHADGPEDEAAVAKPWWTAIDPRANDGARVVGALGIVIGLVILTRLMLRRAGQSFLAARRPSGVIEILARYPVGRGEQLLLLRLVRRVVLLHRAGSTMTTLTEVTDADEVAMLLARIEAGSSSRRADDFQDLLDRLVVDPSRGARRQARRIETAALAGTELVDLTRPSRRGMGRLLGLGKGAA